MFSRGLPSRSPVCLFAARASGTRCPGGEDSLSDFRDRRARFGVRFTRAGRRGEGRGWFWRRCGSPPKEPPHVRYLGTTLFCLFQKVASGFCSVAQGLQGDSRAGLFSRWGMGHPPGPTGQGIPPALATHGAPLFVPCEPTLPRGGGSLAVSGPRAPQVVPSPAPMHTAGSWPASSQPMPSFFSVSTVRNTREEWGTTQDAG